MEIYTKFPSPASIKSILQQIPGLNKSLPRHVQDSGIIICIDFDFRILAVEFDGGEAGRRNYVFPYSRNIYSQWHIKPADAVIPSEAKLVPLNIIFKYRYSDIPEVLVKEGLQVETCFFRQIILYLRSPDNLVVKSLFSPLSIPLHFSSSSTIWRRVWSILPPL